MALFGTSRKPRKFNYNPIYHDPRKTALQRRTEKIRDELIANGELEPTEEDLARHERVKENESHEERLRDKLHQSLRRNTTHLCNQETRGKAGRGRTDEVFRILILLTVLGIVIWFLYYRG